MKTKRPLFYLRRKFDTLLQQWKKRENRLPLIIKGARQVGKTYKDIHWGIKLVNGNVGFENGILTIPQWCAFKLPKIISNFDSSN